MYPIFFRPNATDLQLAKYVIILGQILINDWKSPGVSNIKRFMILNTPPPRNIEVSYAYKKKLCLIFHSRTAFLNKIV